MDKQRYCNIGLLMKTSELLHRLMDSNSFVEMRNISYIETNAIRNEIDMVLIKDILSNKPEKCHTELLNRILNPND